MGNEVLEAVERVIIKRSTKGATKEFLQRYVDHLLNDIWKGCPGICAGIEEIANKYQIKG
jgi:hypothetical protein